MLVRFHSLSHYMDCMRLHSMTPTMDLLLQYSHITTRKVNQELSWSNVQWGYCRKYIRLAADLSKVHLMYTFLPHEIH